MYHLFTIHSNWRAKSALDKSLKTQGGFVHLQCFRCDSLIQALYVKEFDMKK
jgi:hypothetical protein